MGFKTGTEALTQVSNESTRTKFEGAAGSRLNYFMWKPGEKKILRFLSEEDYLKGEFYEFISDNQGTTRSFLIDPDDPDRLLRYKSPTPGIGWKKDFKKGLVPPKPITRGVAIAVLRHEVRDKDGKLVVEDVITQHEVDGETFPARTFGLVIQSGSFWASLESCRERFGSMVDRDYEIGRIGEKLDTKYTILPLPEDPALTDPAVVKEFYGYGVKTDENDPNRFLKCSTTTLDWAKNFSSEDRHKFFLSPDGGKSSDDGSDEAQSSFVATNDANTSFAAFKAAGSFGSLSDTLMSKAKAKQ